MKRRMCFAALVGILLAGLGNVTRASDPRIDGDIIGVELCPQSVCGAAVFAGVFEGRIGWWRYTLGTFYVEVTHEDLPEPYESSDVTGGKWELCSGWRCFRGDVLTGTIFNNGDNTFAVDALLELTRGGSGFVMVEVELNHNTFPPLIYGVMFD